MALKVNLTSDEANSESREVLPSNKYVCNIVDGSINEVKPGRKHVGKPYWKLSFVVQEGPYAGRFINSTVMLFDGALFSLSQLMQSLGYDVNAGSFDVPELDDIIGKTVVVRGLKRAASTDPDGRDLPERFEVKGYNRPPAKGAKAPVDSDLLP